MGNAKDKLTIKYLNKLMNVGDLLIAYIIPFDDGENRQNYFCSTISSLGKLKAMIVLGLSDDKKYILTDVGVFYSTFPDFQIISSNAAFPEFGSRAQSIQ